MERRRQKDHRGDLKRYNAFSSYVKERFGEPVRTISVDAGFPCPNRDGTVGTGGCIFCNADSYRPRSCEPSRPMSDQIRIGIERARKKYKANAFIVYFQPSTNTHAPVAVLEKLYREALSFPGVVGLAIGTRPDAVDEEKIRLLETLARNAFILVEYGVQSIHDKTLAFLNRGHDYASFLKALELTRDRGIAIGAHVIAGCPTETREEMLAMADALSDLPVTFLKIHHLQVIRGTPLALIYRERPFHVFDYDEYCRFIVDFLERLSPRIAVQRLFAEAPEDLLIAPVWNRTKQQILLDIERALAARDGWQGKTARAEVTTGCAARPFARSRSF